MAHSHLMCKIKILLAKLPSAGKAGEEASSEVSGAQERKEEEGECRREKTNLGNHPGGRERQSQKQSPTILPGVSTAI